MEDVKQYPNKGSFKRGHIPWNRNKRGIHLSPKTEFKKGNRPDNWKPVGTIVIRFDKSGTMRQWIKTKEPNIWIEYARYIWIKKYGKIPKGKLICHKNLNSSDDRIENLMVTTHKRHPTLHNRWNTKSPKKIIHSSVDRRKEQERLEKRNLRIKFIRFIRNPIISKKYKNALKFHCEDCGHIIQTCILPKGDNYNKEIDQRVIRELKLFKKVHKKFCKGAANQIKN